VHIIDFD